MSTVDYTLVAISSSDISDCFADDFPTRVAKDSVNYKRDYKGFGIVGRSLKGESASLIKERCRK